MGFTLALSIKIAQKPYIIGSLGPKALTYESFDAEGWGLGPVQGLEVEPTSAAQDSEP